MAGMRQKLADYRIFVREFRETFKHTGALLPSGAALARSVTRPFDESPKKGRRLLEVGPGTGAVTSRIVNLLREGDHLTLVEINQRFADRLQTRFETESRWQRVAHQVDIQAISLLDFDPASSSSAANGNGDADHRFDYVISGMPINNFEIPLATDLFNRLYELLRPGATLSFFEYFAIRRMKGVVSPRSDERQRLKGIGELVSRRLEEDGIGSDLIMANIPPAWVHHVRPGNSGPA